VCIIIVRVRMIRQQIEYLVKQGCVKILSELLSESSMVMMALEGLERVLQVKLHLKLHLKSHLQYT
jgi:hypothetical protein